MRVGRHVTGEQVELLELRSPWAAAPNGTPERTAAKLVEAFRQVVRERRELRLRFPFAEVSISCLVMSWDKVVSPSRPDGGGGLQ
jgi:hypothetical protein